MGAGNDMVLSQVNKTRLVGSRPPESVQRHQKNLTGETSAVSHHLELLEKPQSNFRDLAEKVDKMQAGTLGLQCRAWLRRWWKESASRYIISSDILDPSLFA